MKKTVWLLAGWLALMAFAAAGGGAKAAEKGKETVRNSAGKMVEKPQYGGTFRQGWSRSPQFFDEAFGLFFWATTMWQTNEVLMQGDWAKGPTGTGEASWLYNIIPPPGLRAGCLATSWEITKPGQFIFHIRKGVHFHNKAPTNGREMTAEDVAYSFNRLWKTPRSWQYGSYPWDTHWKSITATDKWTLVCECIDWRTEPLFAVLSTHTFVSPREVIEKYGDMNDWKNSCGTGPFMLTDYVTESSATFVRNPDYWGKDPLHPDNRLPYVDKLKYLIIPDRSTQMAALRTGKIDQLLVDSLDDAESLRNTNPELKHAEYPNGGSPAIFWRVDKPELPFKDKRVRQALTMAVDRKAIVDHFYRGHADVFNWPIPPLREYAEMYVPLDQMPEAIRDLYTYHPEKAKKLLAEAGYPAGFKTEIVCYSANVDLLSIVKANWAGIGVDLDLNVKEYGAYTTVGNKKTYEAMYMSGEDPSVLRFTRLRPGYQFNYSMVDDQHINDVYQKITESYLIEGKQEQLMKELAPYLLDYCPYLTLPSSNLFNFWQPWIKSYSGEVEVGYLGSLYNFPKYVWVDQQLKGQTVGAD